MRFKLGMALFVAVWLMMFSCYAQASTNNASKGKSYLKVAGCLQAGEGVDEYLLVGEDGSTWELKRNGAKLAPHIGQLVEVAGPVLEESHRNGKEEHGKDAAERGRLRVSKFKTIGETCGN